MPQHTNKPNRQGLDDYVLTNEEGLYMTELVDTDGTNNVITVYSPYLYHAYIYKGISSKTAKQLGDEFNLIPVKYNNAITNNLSKDECVDGFCPRLSKTVDKNYTLGK